jgi:hypothetical protein
MPAPKNEPIQKGGPIPQPKAESGRKAWKKRSHEDVILAEIDKLRKEVAEHEASLVKKKEQLKKLDDVAKSLS